MKKFTDRKTFIFYTLLFCIVGISSNQAFSQDHGHAGDIFIYVDKGHIETGLVDEDVTEEHVRVFESEFGESGLPEYTDEPGWEAFPGTFDPQLRVGWNAVHGLERWNGNGFDGSLDETIIVNFSTLTFEIGPEPVDGFDLAVAPDGSFHRHIGFLIDHPIGNPAAGIYLVELELYATVGITGFTPEHSEPFWIVFNYLGSEEDHEEAVLWVEQNLAGVNHCYGDVNDSHDVDIADLLLLISDWGSCTECETDLNEDGNVDVTDMLELIAVWGECH